MEKDTDSRQGLLAREDCLIVIIDMQERLLPVIAEKEKILQNTLRLLRFADVVGIPVVITEQEKLGSTVAEAKEAKQGLPPIHKVYFNCFSASEFAHTVIATGRKTLILAGVEAHICVAQTAVFAARSYGVHVVADAGGSRNPENAALALARMRQAGATISSTEMFMYEILAKAGTEEFKAVLQLVK